MFDSSTIIDQSIAAVTLRRRFISASMLEMVILCMMMSLTRRSSDCHLARAVFVEDTPPNRIWYFLKHNSYWISQWIQTQCQHPLNPFIICSRNSVIVCSNHFNVRDAQWIVNWTNPKKKPQAWERLLWVWEKDNIQMSIKGLRKIKCLNKVLGHHKPPEQL